MHGDSAKVTLAGARFLTGFGIDVAALGRSRRKLCRMCLDWTERRNHIAGKLGAALTDHCFDLGWLERVKRSSAVTVTATGKRGFRSTFGIDVSTAATQAEQEPIEMRRFELTKTKRR